MTFRIARVVLRRTLQFGRQSPWTSSRFSRLERIHRSLAVRSIVVHSINTIRYIGEPATPPLDVQGFPDDEDGT
jgi:hypothetical protein